jgi:hypothetical protein
VALAQRRGAVPPIEVYRAGGLHFVSDGHHRVSIAAATGQEVIDAYVTEVPGVPTAGTARRGRTVRPTVPSGPATGHRAPGTRAPRALFRS